MEDIAHNPKQFLQLLQSYRLTEGNENATSRDLYSALKQGLDPNSLQYSTYDINHDKA
jgi:hypothetical protein